MTFSIDLALVIQLLISTVLPLLVGLVTTRVTDSSVKAWLLAGLSLVTSLVVEFGDHLATGTTYDIGQGLLLALPTFLIAVGMHYGIYKPTGTSEVLQDIGTH